jgi:hypothetical protein
MMTGAAGAAAAATVHDESVDTLHCQSVVRVYVIFLSKSENQERKRKRRVLRLLIRLE